MYFRVSLLKYATEWKHVQEGTENCLERCSNLFFTMLPDSVWIDHNLFTNFPINKHLPSLPFWGPNKQCCKYLHVCVLYVFASSVSLCMSSFCAVFLSWHEFSGCDYWHILSTYIFNLCRFAWLPSQKALIRHIFTKINVNTF